MSFFDASYRAIGEVARGDALSAVRAVAPDGSAVIVKTVRPFAPARFVAELPALAAVIDPHLERIVTWEQRGELVAIATQPVVGERLGDVPATSGPLPVDQVIGLGVDAALGLEALHDKGLLHGGLKPATIVRDPRAGAVLVDAGLARAAGGADLGESSPPEAAAFVSPEEALGRPLSAASDVYALGVVLYRLATGRLPFAGVNAEQVARAHVGESPVAPRLVRPELPLALEGVLLRCLAKQPEDRFADGRELVRALEGELPVASFAAPVVPPPSRRRAIWPWVTTGLVALAVMIGVLWATGVFASKATVPDVVGMSLSRATATLDAAGFKQGETSYQQATGKAQGTVLSQSPVAASTARKGSPVSLVAVGTSLEAVPSVVGMTESAASTRLGGAGLQLGNVTGVYSDATAEGVVVDQAPAAGLEVQRGSAVAVTVSRGAKPAASPAAVAVPDVTGQNKSAAAAALTAAGFAVVVEQASDSTVPSGDVIDQSPSAGVLAQPGSTVTVLVSTGPSAPRPTASP